MIILDIIFLLCLYVAIVGGLALLMRILYYLITGEWAYRKNTGSRDDGFTGAGTFGSQDGQ